MTRFLISVEFSLNMPCRVNLTFHPKTFSGERFFRGGRTSIIRMKPRTLLGRAVPGKIPHCIASIIPLLTAYPNLPATSSDISSPSINTTHLGHIADIPTNDIDLRRCGESNFRPRHHFVRSAKRLWRAEGLQWRKGEHLPSVVYNVAVKEVGDQTGFCSRVLPARPQPRPACPERAASCARSYKV